MSISGAFILFSYRAKHMSCPQHACYVQLLIWLENTESCGTGSLILYDTLVPFTMLTLSTTWCCTSLAWKVPFSDLEGNVQSMKGKNTSSMYWNTCLTFPIIILPYTERNILINNTQSRLYVVFGLWKKQGSPTVNKIISRAQEFVESHSEKKWLEVLLF